MGKLSAKLRRPGLRGAIVLAAACVSALAGGYAYFAQSLSGPNDRQQTGASAPEIHHWKSVPDLPRQIAVFDTVFWEPADTESLRALIREGSLVRGKSVLEIGTGSGLLSLCCLQAGAARVVATDVNPGAVANARYNARLLGLDDRLEVRQVPLDNAAAWSVLEEGERFDLIVSNPPWEDRRPQSIAEYALYDPGFELLGSLLAGLRDRLHPGGRALLAYGCRDAIHALHDLAEEQELDVKQLDDRDLESLPEVFLPGMLLEVTPREAPADNRRDDATGLAPNALNYFAVARLTPAGDTPQTLTARSARLVLSPPAVTRRAPSGVKQALITHSGAGSLRSSFNSDVQRQMSAPKPEETSRSPLGDQSRR
jgi:release factor glutamine methyltransferase